MGSPYPSQTASGYNASPPADDGSVTAANKVKYATLKTQLGDPVKGLADSINSALRTAFDTTPTSHATNYSTAVTDHLKPIEVTGTTTISLGDAATMVAQSLGYEVPIVNVGTGTVTVGLVTAANTLAGQANGTVTLAPGQGMRFAVNSTNNGYDITAATGFAPVVLTGASGTNTITANAPSNLTALFNGLVVVLTPTGANTGAATLNITPSGGSALTAKNIFWKGAALAGRELSAVPVVLIYDGTQFNIAGPQALVMTVARSYLAGLTMSTAGSSTTMTIAAGQASDSTNALMMNLSASISKTTGAWAVGSAQGGLDTGSIANSTWYHFWLIMRPDTGVVDVLISLSASSPTMPTNYTLKRRIGAGKTDGSGNWTAFTQDGDYFRWAASVLDVNTTNPGTSAVTSTLTVPTGVNVQAFGNASLTDSTATLGYLSDPSANDEAVSTTGVPLGNIGSVIANGYGANQFQIRTNTSAQIRYRLGTSGASTIIRIATLGWIDRRGRDA